MFDMAGIVMEGKKDLSISTEIVDVSNPSKVYVPLINCGVLCTATAKKGKKVLLIDEDPQGNATSGLGISKEREKSTYDIIIDEIDINEAIVDTGIKNLRNMPI